MVKRLVFVAIVLTAILVVAAPALAFSGARSDYDDATVCATCHTDTPGIPQVYGEWTQTGHGKAGAEGQYKRLPYGSVCQGCHTGNFDPTKAVPSPTATAKAAADGSTAISWGTSNGLPVAGMTGDAASTENVVGCSACHQSKTAAHSAPQSNLANAEICGQCHSRYAYTVNTYSVAPVPYLKIGADGKPVPNPTQTTLVQPQMAIGFNTMGNAANSWTPDDLNNVLNVGYPGWTPTPNPSATAGGYGKLQTFWQLDGVDTPYIQRSHDGNASQYSEWSGPADLHAQALDNLKKAMGPNPPAACLECHSADYIIAPDDAKPTGEQAKYGITCQACHTPHSEGTAKGVWSDEWRPQLRYDDAKTLCTSCHNAELAEGAIAVPGSTVHHPMKEMMNGTGAIGVPQGSPSVHRGKCVQCHMPPTTYSGVDVLGQGVGANGANHTFKIIEPVEAAEVTPLVIATYTPIPTLATPTPSARPVSAGMPYSACSTCHSRPGDPEATWVQGTLDDRQAAMHRWNDQVTVALTKAAKRLGFKSTAAANTAINKKPMKKWSKGQMAFQKSFTNQSYVVSEGSWGIHNWEYARTIILMALSQANSARK